MERIGGNIDEEHPSSPMQYTVTSMQRFAVPSEGRWGREHPEQEDDLRTPFGRDRDRLLHSSAMRSLAGKTQVFSALTQLNVRTRYTHTMEVAFIADTLAKNLHLNAELAMAIAFAHDLGHPPFGHAGEDALNDWMQRHGRKFEHNAHGLRIVTTIERHTSKFKGLNLTKEVLFGMQKHSDVPRTWEALIVNLADEIAYLSHDCDDGLSARLFLLESLLEVPIARDAYEKSHPKDTFLKGYLLEELVRDLLTECRKRSSTAGFEVPTELDFSPETRARVKVLRDFLFDNMYHHPTIEANNIRGQEVLDQLCMQLFAAPTEQVLAMQAWTGSDLVDAVKDTVAQMSDVSAVMEAHRLGISIPSL